jgi:hypothetical protein
MDSRHLHNPDNAMIMMSIDFLEDKLRQIKTTIQDILAMLELQDRVHFPELLDLLSNLACSFSYIQDQMKKSCVQKQNEDNGLLMKSHLLVPNFISLEEDPKLLVGLSFMEL